jgi:hypothetical protein
MELERLINEPLEEMAKQQKIAKRLESHMTDLARTRAFLPATESKLFKTHMDELDKQVKNLTDAVAWNQEAGAIRIYLGIISDDVSALVPRMRSPYKEGMEGLVTAIAETKKQLS